MRALRLEVRMAQEMGSRLGQREVLLRQVQRLMAGRFARIVYVPFDHLSFDHGALKAADLAKDLVVLVESKRMVVGRPWHKERLFFLISSARHFAKAAEARGFTVRYLNAETTIHGLTAARNEFGDLPIVCAEPSSFRQFAQLQKFGVEFVANDFFLTSRTDFQLWAARQKTFVMENFYRAQRVRLDILMQSGEPVGGRWNYDADNRLPPPKNYTWPKHLTHKRDEIDREVEAELGHTATETWATTREGALAQLQNFIDNHLFAFGPYEDAIA